jgi:hypothetical protein
MDHPDCAIDEIVHRDQGAEPLSRYLVILAKGTPEGAAGEKDGA